MPARRPNPGQNPAEQHAEWLRLLRPDGPFLALPVLTEVFRSGLDLVPDAVRDRVRQAWGEVQDAPDLLLPAWYDLIVHELLRIPAREVADGATVPALRGRATPHQVAYGPGPDGRAMRLFCYRYGWNDSLTKGHGDQPAPVERAAALCRETGVPIALVTNGRLWALVHTRPQEATSVAVFDADLWLEEPLLLRAFVTLLDARRALAPPRRPDGSWSDGLAALFARSAEAHTQVTDTLGRQVRQAVELLVAELARLDRESGGALLRDVAEREIYRGALTVLMRLVFLLYAEEQELLPVDDRLYGESYSVRPPRRGPQPLRRGGRRPPLCGLVPAARAVPCGARRQRAPRPAHPGIRRVAVRLGHAPVAGPCSRQRPGRPRSPRRAPHPAPRRATSYARPRGPSPRRRRAPLIQGPGRRADRPRV
jgi:hypothetical protein